MVVDVPQKGGGVEQRKLWVEDRPPKKGEFVLCVYDGRETTGLVLDVNCDQNPTRFNITSKTYEQYLRRSFPHTGARWVPGAYVRPLVKREFKGKHGGRMAALDRIRNSERHLRCTRK